MKAKPEDRTLIDFTQKLVGTDGEPLQIAEGRKPDGTANLKTVTLRHACDQALFGIKSSEQDKINFKDILRRGKVSDTIAAGDPLSAEDINILMDRLDMLRPDIAYAAAKLLDPVRVKKA